MTIFKEIIDEEYLTIAETKEVLSGIEEERADDEDREMRYELARAIEHVNRLAVLEGEEARELVERLEEHKKVSTSIAFKIADTLPRDRTELRAIYAQERFSVDGDDLDEILEIVAEYR